VIQLNYHYHYIVCLLSISPACTYISISSIKHCSWHRTCDNRTKLLTVVDRASTAECFYSFLFQWQWDDEWAYIVQLLLTTDIWIQRRKYQLVGSSIGKRSEKNLGLFWVGGGTCRNSSVSIPAIQMLLWNLPMHATRRSDRVRDRVRAVELI
jgi:hypothetical protein